MAPRRVAITGLGIISPLGLNLTESWNALREGRPGIGPITGVDMTIVQTKIQNGAEVRGFDATQHFEGGKDNYLDRFAQFSVVAAREALRDSGLELTATLRDRGAVVCGSAVGGQTAIETGFVDLYVSDRGRVHPLTIPKTMSNAGASQISMELGDYRADLHGFDGMLLREPCDRPSLPAGPRWTCRHRCDRRQRGAVHDRNAQGVGSHARNFA